MYPAHHQRQFSLLPATGAIEHELRKWIIPSSSSPTSKSVRRSWSTTAFPRSSSDGPSGSFSVSFEFFPFSVASLLPQLTEKTSSIQFAKVKTTVEPKYRILLTRTSELHYLLRSRRIHVLVDFSKHGGGTGILVCRICPTGIRRHLTRGWRDATFALERIETQFHTGNSKIHQLPHGGYRIGRDGKKRLYDFIVHLRLAGSLWIGECCNELKVSTVN